VKLRKDSLPLPIADVNTSDPSTLIAATDASTTLIAAAEAFEFIRYH
jgi:hypothetical protein